MANLCRMGEETLPEFLVSVCDRLEYTAPETCPFIVVNRFVGSSLFGLRSGYGGGE